MLAHNTRPTGAQKRAQKAIGMGHDDMANHVSNPELLTLLKPYRFTYGYVGAGGSPTNLWLGFGRFTVEEVERVFADPLGRRALMQLLSAYRQLGFSVRVWQAFHFEGWGYEVQGERGGLLTQQRATSEMGAWAAAAYRVNGLLLQEHLPELAEGAHGA